MSIVQQCARQRQCHGEGARGPVGMAAAPARLEAIKEARPGGGVAPVTPLGYLTTVRALPRVLAALPRNDPRRQAADMLAGAYERIGAVQGGTVEGGDTKGGQFLANRSPRRQGVQAPRFGCDADQAQTWQSPGN